MEVEGKRDLSINYDLKNTCILPVGLASHATRAGKVGRYLHSFLTACTPNTLYTLITYIETAALQQLPHTLDHPIPSSTIAAHSTYLVFPKPRLAELDISCLVSSISRKGMSARQDPLDRCRNYLYKYWP